MKLFEARVRVWAGKNAKKVEKALAPETEFRKRSRITVCADGEHVDITIRAEDFVALRAALATYMRFLKTALSVIEVAEKEGKNR